MRRILYRLLTAWLLSVWLGAAILLSTALDPAEAQPKQVLMLHSFGRDFKPWSEYGKAIRAELDRQSPWPLDITDHSLVSARSVDDNPEVPFVEYLRAIYEKRPLDLIVSIGAPAAAFVQRHRQDLFANTPMVFTAVDQRRVQYSILTRNDTVIPVRINYLAAFENILQVLPDTKNVTIVVGTSPIEKVWSEEIAREVSPLAGRITFGWTSNLSFEDLLTQAAALPAHHAIFWELMIVDAAGIVHEGATPLTRLRAIASAPIFSYDESFFGLGIVGGPLLLVQDSSRETAAVAVRILKGENAGEIKTAPVQFATPRFDWREMQRWGISEAQLPPGSEVHFREPTALERYRWQIALITVVLMLQAALITGLLYEHRRRRRAEIETRQRMSELAHMNRHATAGELSASIAHELNQPLGAILNNTETAAVLLSAPSPNLDEIKTIISEIRRDDERASEIILRLRRLLKKERFEAQAVDLNETVREVFALLSVQAAARNVSLDSRLTSASLKVRGDKVQLQQVILNLVINGMESMMDTSYRQRVVTGCTMLLNDGFAEISIADFGPGIPSGKLKEVFEPFFTTKNDGMGMGLPISRTIIETHGGRIWAENQSGGGAIFRVSLPLAKAH